MNYYEDLRRDIVLYVHWPFCISKCPYCDFNSHVEKNVDHIFWKSAFLNNLDYEFERLPDAKLKAIFFGGGTPSLMEPDLIQSIISKAKRSWKHESEIEITIEANPSSLNSDLMKQFKDAGINRFSIGVQSFNDKELSFLGRNHSSSNAKEAMFKAKEVFNRISIDLIYALPDHNTQVWYNQLTRAFDVINQIECNHISCYQLTIEENTPFKVDFDKGVFKLPNDDISSELYTLTNEIITSNGMRQYEVSNYARYNENCEHNLHIWRGGSYVGIGPGAHGRIFRDNQFYATFKPKSPRAWVNKVSENNFFFAKDYLITAKIRAQEILILALRLSEGINLNNLCQISGAPINEIVDIKKLNELRDSGLVDFYNNNLSITPTGLLVLNYILSQIII